MIDHTHLIQRNWDTGRDNRRDHLGNNLSINNIKEPSQKIQTNMYKMMLRLLLQKTFSYRILRAINVSKYDNFFFNLYARIFPFSSSLFFLSIEIFAPSDFDRGSILESWDAHARIRRVFKRKTGRQYPPISIIYPLHENVISSRQGWER